MLAAVVIGRNEGDRLVRCLASLQGRASPIVYVDSGSTDGSVKAAGAAGAMIVELDMRQSFTAARARNAGLALLEQVGAPDLVQMVDGDCEIREGWLEAALTFLSDHPDVAMVAGRLRERFPDATLWNRLADAEWDTPTGVTGAVGGIAVLRRGVVAKAGGYRDDMIAGEEPELCLRLRRIGWRIWRLADEMAWHDIAMTRMSQWWRRSRRHGHALAEGAALHGAGPEAYEVSKARRALIWGAGVPLVATMGALIWWPALFVFLVWPAQVLRLKMRGETWTRAIFLAVVKIPEAQGIIGYHIARLKGAAPRIIEYK